VEYAAELRAWLERLQWTHSHFAAWLTDQGSPTSRATVSRWLAVSDRSDKSTCPSWPIAMLENIYQHGKNMKTIVMANHKGGVGKSTLLCHLAFDLSRLGHKVLVIDLDDQGNTSLTLERYLSPILASSLFGARATLPRGNEDATSITVVPGDPALVHHQQDSMEVIDYFATALEEVEHGYDYCLIDTPPSAGLFMAAALMVADHVVSPIELDRYSIHGISRMMKMIFDIQRNGNEQMQFVGMLPNRYDPRSLSQTEMLNDLREQYYEYLIDAPIGIRSAIPQALDQGVPVWEIKKTSARDAAKQIRAALQIIYKRMETSDAA
jgi:chromosome partitioning protein